MFVADIFEAPQKNLIVVYPGRFQPFHKGHKAVYDYLSKKYGRDAVYIATSNKTDNLKSPFSFSDKSQFMAATGVSLDRVIETKQPYQVPELTSKLNPNTTIIVYAVSQKDMDEDPRFASWTKKDGSPAHFQPMPADPADMLTFSHHSYIEVVPTFDFKVLGQPMRSASEIRAMYKSADDDTKQALIKDLFGKYTPELKHIMDTKLGSLEEGKITKALGTAAMAAGLGLGSPAQASDNPVADVAKIGLTGLRTVNAIKGMTKADVKGEINQEIGNIVRGDKNASRLYQLTKKPPEIKNDPQATDQDARDRMMRGEDREVDETIRKVKDGYRLLSRKGKNLGTYPSKAGAEKRERQVQYFKHMGEGDVVDFSGKTPPPNFENAIELAKTTIAIIKDPNVPNFETTIANYRSGLKKLGYYLRFTPEGVYLVNPRANHKTLIDDLKDISEAASGYIPKNSKEARDPRWSNALTVDVKTDTMKKGIAAFFPTKVPAGRLKQIKEGIVDFDKQDPMNSVTAPPEGFGSMPLRDWKKSLARRLKELTAELEQYTDPTLIDKNIIWDKIVYLLDPKSPISVIAREIARAHTELETIRSKGGSRSRGIES